ncbi:MAG: dockerin type I repeat-containing protein [Bacteroidaceae bacterium]
MEKIFSLIAVMLCVSLLSKAEDKIMLNIVRNNVTQWTMSVALENTENVYGGFQMDFVLPEGFSVDLSTLETTSRLSNITVQTNLLSSGNVRVVGYAASKTKNITGTSGDIFSIKFNSAVELTEGTFSVVAKNVRFTNATVENLLAGVTQSFGLDPLTTHNVNFWNNGELYKTIQVVVGNVIPTDDEPVGEEGYSFCGWGEVPSVMPDQDVDLYATWCRQSFLLSYSVEGKVVHSEMVAYGDTLPDFTPEDVVGYSFCGWTDAPETMPASNLTIHAKMCVKYYTLSYIVDGEVMHSEDVAYQSALPQYEPDDKEGYTFIGWKDAPESMPASDLSLEAEWKVNTYNVNYYVDGELVYTQKVDYGATFDLYDYKPEESNKYLFIGWRGDVYESMPAYDISYETNLVLLGDVNLDGDLNSSDVVAIYNYISEGEDSGVKRVCADLNGDGSINAADVATEYNLIVFGSSITSKKYRETLIELLAD